MRHFILLFLVLFSGIQLMANKPSASDSGQAFSFSETELLSMKPREIAKETGVRLNFFERMIIRKVQKKARKAHAKADGGTATASLVLGIIAFLSVPLTFVLHPLLFFLSIITGIIGTALGAVGMSKLDGPAQKRARTGFWLSLTGGLLMIVVMLGWMIAWT